MEKNFVSYKTMHFLETDELVNKNSENKNSYVFPVNLNHIILVLFVF